ncbi:hypothetical protein HPB52_023784 [Rhipicephalus sanguineus]|uniref:Endonuclease/exonuclease/phosphatase domain-containing protein n=1 Tax=Rhipicephalus sanguineus TaxID=34632 RepID=A0A9D4Q6A9_RHISA|nr:hypothetical protein HPB52_023784 [Rhipicephalus sanguineus]
MGMNFTGAALLSAKQLQEERREDPAEAAGRVEPTTGAAHTRSSSRRTTPTDTAADEDDAESSVSETTAVETGRRADFGTHTQARARELEDQISRFCADSANRITVSARNYILSRVFELVGLCSDLRADAAVERGRAAAAALGRPGIHGPDTDVPLGAPPTLLGPTGSLSYAAVLRPGPTTGGQPLGRPGFPGGATGPGGATTMATRHDHVAFLTPTGTTDAPARDVVRVLKANIDPVAKDIRDVTLRYTRYGVTVFTNTRQSLLNMRAAIEGNAVTRAAMTIRVPDKRNPHIRFSRVDPEITPDAFLRLLNERNPSLQLDMERSKVRVTFRERGGRKAFVVEVDPPAYHRIMACPRLSKGWTIVRVYEDLHVSTCTYCASYGRGRSSCPVAGDPSKKVYIRCGAEGHLGADCAALEDVVARSRSPNIVVAGDLNAKHLAWRLRAGDDRGARVVEFAAAAGLVFLNDPASEPTYETAYAASWIDVTLATPALAAGYTWQDTLRILGVVFDRRLSFFAHADHLREKTEALAAKRGTLAHMQGGQLRPIQKSRSHKVPGLKRHFYLGPGTPESTTLHMSPFQLVEDPSPRRC